MTPSPELQAREQIDVLLSVAGWLVQDADQANIHAGRGVAIREFPLKSGHGFADYLLYVDGKATGVIEAKKVGSTLTGVEIQSDKYTKGLPEGLPRWHNPLPFSFQSTYKTPMFVLKGCSVSEKHVVKVSDGAAIPMYKAKITDIWHPEDYAYPLGHYNGRIKAADWKVLLDYFDNRGELFLLKDVSVAN